MVQFTAPTRTIPQNGSSAQPTIIIGQPQVMAITPTLAVYLVGTYPFGLQRNTHTPHVDRLTHAIQQGTFKPGTIELHYARDSAKIYLTDGQHRLQAIARSGQTVSMVVMCYEVAAFADVQSAYAVTDRNHRRTVGNVLDAYGMSDRLDLPKHVTSLLNAATVPILSGFNNPTTLPICQSDEAKVRMMERYAPQAHALLEVYGYTAHQGLGRMLLNATPFAVALVTLAAAAEESEAAMASALRFWRNVARGENLQQGMPAYAFREWLLSVRHSLKPRVVEYSRLIARAWNAYKRGQSLKVLRAGDAGAPLLLVGTPYNGRDLILPFGTGRS